MDISIDDIIEINRQQGGNLSIDGSLDFALDAGKGRSVYTRIALILRAILIDHPFTDINKRTALDVAVVILKRDKINLNAKQKEQLVKEIMRITKKNIVSIANIERRIRYAVEGH